MKNVAIVVAACSLLSCASVPREGWSMGGAEMEKGVELFIPPGGGEAVSLVSPYFGEDVEIRGIIVPSVGTVPREGEEGSTYRIELTELRYFSNWERGWTDAVFRLAGSISLSFRGGAWVPSVIEEPEIGEPATAELRYMDTYLAGDRAAEAVRHRLDRIEAAVAVWREDGCLWFERPTKKKKLFSRERGKSFEETVGPVFFPEVYGYMAGSWKEGPWVRGDGRSWDTAYTKSRFPDQLWSVRDSGTLYRDWEEGFFLWYLVSQWSTFWDCKFPVATISILNIEGAKK